MSVDGTQPPKLGFTVVGIGASAGGLEAYTEFFDAMPPDRGLAFVLVQHLSPKRESMVADILQKHTRMPVLQVDDGMRVEPNHVYVIRPGHTMTIENGRLHLGESLLKPGHSRPVDDFFRSLAEEQRERAVAILLSGMGSNGTAGAQAIKVVGGVCIAQEPDSAKFPSMPRALIDANLADYILKPQEMPAVLLRYTEHTYVSGKRSAESVAQREAKQIGEILAILRARVRHDFTGYKKPTIVRRIQRRMSLTQQTSMAEYARLLRQTPVEVTNLSDDLMIHVTGFFRDPEVWDALRERVIRPMVIERADQASIRCWVTACASGEEAYTLAMLLVEAAEQADKRFDIKVFATDMAERALVHARAGLYPGGIESEISPGRLARFFDREESVYRIKKELRERVVFAPQNVLQDPPFSRLDIVTCRNLLIYLEPETQQKVLGLIHFGLKDGGTLVLGNSETIGERDDLFEVLDKKLRLYRRIGSTRHGMLKFPSASTLRRFAGDADAPEARTLSRASLTQIANKLLLETYTPPAVVVDRQGRIAFFHGETEQYLDQPRGEPTRELLVLVHENMRGPVRVALNQAIDSGATSTVKDGLIEINETQYRVEVTAAPMDSRGLPGYFLVSFNRYPVSVVPVSVNGGTSDAEVAEELRSVRDELQSTVEELQTSNEELRASNEEVTSINEELQSTNEELETSKEELQSLNEELTTVNAQLQAKMEDLDRTSNDLQCLLSSTDIAVIFLDTKFRIRRYTPAVKRLMDLIPGDIGRPLADLARRFDDPSLLDDAATVLESMQPAVSEVGSDDGRWFARRVLPYRTADNRIEGVVVTFVDVTERRIAEQRVRENDERLGLLLMASGESLYRMSPDWGSMLVLKGNKFLSDTTASNQTWLDRYIPMEDRVVVMNTIQTAVAGKAMFTLEHRVRRADGTVGWTLSRAVPVLDARGEIIEWFGIASDIMSRKEIEQAVQTSEEKYRTLFNSMDEAYSVVEMIRDEQSGTWADFLFVEVNPAFVKQTGMPYPVGKTATQILGTPNPRWAEVYGRVADTGEPVRLEEREPTLDRVFDLYVFRLGGDGSRRVAALFTNVTERKRAEEALREYNLRFESVADLVPDLLWSSRPDGHTAWYNQRWVEYTGQNPEHAVGWGWTDAVHPDDREGSAARYREAADSGRTLVQEHRLRRHDGKYRWFLVRAEPVRDDAGGVTMFGSATDIHDQRIIVAALRESESRYSTLIANLPSGAAFVVDTDVRYTLAEGEALRDAGLTSADFVGKTLAEALPPEQAAAYEPRYRQALAGETFQQEHTDYGRTYVTRGGPLRDAEGRVNAAIAVSYDITDRKRAEAERATLLDAEQHARTAAENANAGKDLFLANLSHELRTPLSAMLIWSKVLQDQPDADTLNEGLASIEQSAKAQQKLIDDLLDSARIATGKLSLELRPVDLGQVIREAVATLRPTADAKGIELTVDVGKTVGVVMVDADRLRQVVWNLVNNALKFTPEGGRVDVGVWRRDGHVEFRVSDNGVGIDADLLPQIFGRFQQADPSRTRRQGGLGLGLSISRQIVELHGGTIAATSDGPGRGSVFTVNLPLPRTKTTARPAKAHAELAGVRIALVEDDEQLRDVVTMLLQRAGASVQSFAAADPAKAAVLAGPPDVLLSDIGLPDKDGYALIRDIRDAERPGTRLPAIAFTAFDRPQDRAHAIECGFDEHLAKPVDPAKLVQLLRTLLRK